MRAALSVSEYERLRIRNEVEGTDVPLDSCLRRNDGAASRNLEFCVACQLDLWVTISAEAGAQGDAESARSAFGLGIRTATD